MDQECKVISKNRISTDREAIKAEITQCQKVIEQRGMIKYRLANNSSLKV
jgi:hypothetical protein